MTGYAFLDFECDSSGAFYMAGSLIDGRFEQVVLHPSLKPAAEARGLPFQDPISFIGEFITRLQKQGRILVAFSTAELNAIKRAQEADGASQCSLEYCNILKAARRWIKSSANVRESFDSFPPIVLGVNTYTQRRQRYSLASVMRLTDFVAPATYHPGQTSARFKSVIAALVRHEGYYGQLSAVQKAKLTKALRHNEYDVRALPVLVEAIRSACPRALTFSTQSTVI